MEMHDIIHALITLGAAVMFFVEHYKRRKVHSEIVFFLHGLKSCVEHAGVKEAVIQINDILARLDPPKNRS